MNHILQRTKDSIINGGKKAITLGAIAAATMLPASTQAQQAQLHTETAVTTQNIPFQRTRIGIQQEAFDATATYDWRTQDGETDIFALHINPAENPDSRFDYTGALLHVGTPGDSERVFLSAAAGTEIGDVATYLQSGQTVAGSEHPTHFMFTGANYRGIDANIGFAKDSERTWWGNATIEPSTIPGSIGVGYSAGTKIGIYTAWTPDRTIGSFGFASVKDGNWFLKTKTGIGDISDGVYSTGTGVLANAELSLAPFTPLHFTDTAKGEWTVVISGRGNGETARAQATLGNRIGENSRYGELYLAAGPDLNLKGEGAHGARIEASYSKEVGGVNLLLEANYNTTTGDFGGYVTLKRDL